MDEIWRAQGADTVPTHARHIAGRFHNLITAFIDLLLRGSGMTLPRLRDDDRVRGARVANRACQPIEWEGIVNSQDVVRLKTCSENEFAYWGLKDFAYIRPVLIDGQPKMAVHAANGTQVAVLETLAAAQLAILQNDMEPLSVH